MSVCHNKSIVDCLPMEHGDLLTFKLHVVTKKSCTPSIFSLGSSVSGVHDFLVTTLSMLCFNKSSSSTVKQSIDKC